MGLSTRDGDVEGTQEHDRLSSASISSITCSGSKVSWDRSDVVAQCLGLECDRSAPAASVFSS